MKREKPLTFQSIFFPFTTKKAIIFIILIGFVVYFNSLFNGFAIDDLGLIVTNPNVHTIASIPDIFLNYTRTQLGSNRPLPSSIYAILYTFFQTNTFAYHLIQIILHISNAVLIFIIFKKFLKQGLSFFLAVLFLVHPINEETVVYIANLQDVLFVFCGLLSLYLLQINSRLRHVIFANILLLMSLFSKETAILFLAVTSLYVYFYKKSRLLLHGLFMLIISAIYICFRLISNSSVLPDQYVPIMRMSLPERMVNIPAIILYYIRILLFPKDMVALHSWVIREIQFSNFFLPLIIDLLFIATLSLMFIYIYRKEKDRKPVIFFSVWFLCGLVLTLQFIPLNVTVADRYFYFPLIGLLAIIGLFYQAIKPKRIEKVFLVMAVALLLVLSLRTMVRNSNWKNQSILLAHDEKLAKNDYLQELSFGLNLIEQNKYNQAFPHVQQAINLYPQSWKAWTTLGALYYIKGNFPQAENAYFKVISIRNYSVAYEDLALILIKYDNIIKARDFIRKAVKLYPNSQKLWFYSIVTENKTGNYAKALQSAKNYYELTKDKEGLIIYSHLEQKLPIDIELR